MISVVMPCYNAAATLRETLDSALSQDVELEIVVVDDGSTDASADVLRSYGERIRFVSTPNAGASAARTLGTGIARGRFIQYLDSDDLLAPGTLAARRTALEEAGGDVGHTDWQKLVQQPDGGFVPGEIVWPDVAAIARDAEAATATSAFWAPPVALLYRRSIVDRIGPWSPRLPVIQDARFLFDAAAAGARFVHVPGVGAHYRVMAGSLSRRSVGRFIADCAVNAAEIEKHWRERGAVSDERRGAIASMWQHVAMSSLLNGLEEFERARAGYNGSAARRPLFEAGWLLRSALGPARAGALLNGIRRVRKTVRGDREYPAMRRA